MCLAAQPRMNILEDLYDDSLLKVDLPKKMKHSMPIPDSAIDGNTGHSNPVKIYTVGRQYYISSRAKEALWGTPMAAETRATFEATVTAENASLIRSHHPALAKEKYVQIIEEEGRRSWRIFKTSFDDTPAQIVDADVHVVPFHNSPVLAGGSWFDRAYLPDPILRNINPRRCLRPADTTIVRRTFPSAIGIRILISRFALIVYRNADQMYEDWNTGVPGTLGGLTLGYILEDFEPSTITLPSGMSTSTSANNYTDVAALGLRLRMPDGRECVTTVTHALIHYKRKPPMKRFFSHWARMARNSLERFQHPTTPMCQPAQIFTAATKSHNILGRQVWAAGTNDLLRISIGTVEKIYDFPQEDVPFPAGYKHDLSLIYSDHLPFICPPPNTEMVAQWGRYEDALDGAPVFAVSFNSRYERWGTLKGNVASGAVRRAVVHGNSYGWQDNNVSLLWRTHEDSRCAQGWSGSVLCLGQPGQEALRPMLFQNYQEIFHRWPVGEVPTPSETLMGSVKGGFFSARRSPECPNNPWGQRDRASRKEFS